MLVLHQLWLSHLCIRNVSYKRAIPSLTRLHFYPFQTSRTCIYNVYHIFSVTILICDYSWIKKCILGTEPIFVTNIVSIFFDYIFIINTYHFDIYIHWKLIHCSTLMSLVYNRIHLMFICKVEYHIADGLLTWISIYTNNKYFFCFAMPVYYYHNWKL